MVWLVLEVLEVKWCYWSSPAEVKGSQFGKLIWANVPFQAGILSVILTRSSENHVGNIPGAARPAPRLSRSHRQLGLQAPLQRHHDLHVRLLAHCIGKAIRGQSNRLYSHEGYSRGKQIILPPPPGEILENGSLFITLLSLSESLSFFLLKYWSLRMALCSGEVFWSV